MNRQSKKITADYTRIDKGGNPNLNVVILTDQQKNLTRFAEQRRLDNIFLFSDCGYNGRDDSRPDFQRLLTAIRQGEVNAPVLFSVDRLYRDSVKCVELIEEVLPRSQVDFYAVKDGISSNTPMPHLFTELFSSMGGVR